MKNFPQILLLLIATTMPFVQLNNTDDKPKQQQEEEEEGKDMAKAVAISDRLYWRTMMDQWHCEDIGGGQQQQSGQKNALKKLEGICENWKLKASAADAYVKSWKCKQQKDEVGDQKTPNQKNEDKSLKCLCVKPQFHVATPQLRMATSELHLSSAMLAIKTVYNDLFGWGNGDGLKREVLFMNQDAWQSVDRWLGVYGKAQKMLKIAKSEIEKDEHFKGYYISGSEFAHENSRIKMEFGEDTIKKNVDDQQHKTATIIRELLSKLSDELRNFEEMNIKIMGKIGDGKIKENVQKKLLEAMNKTDVIYEHIWELSHELGLDMAAMCKAGKEFISKFGDKKAKKGPLTKYKFEQQRMEEELGKKLLVYKQAVHDPMLEKYPNELNSLHDPCEEAELKVKK